MKKGFARNMTIVSLEKKTFSCILELIPLQRLLQIMLSPLCQIIITNLRIP
jgi:hypothetical protein